MQIKNIILSVVASAAAINAAAIPVLPADAGVDQTSEGFRTALASCMTGCDTFLETTRAPTPAEGVETICSYCVEKFWELCIKDYRTFANTVSTEQWCLVIDYQKCLYVRSVGAKPTEADYAPPQLPDVSTPAHVTRDAPAEPAPPAVPAPAVPAPAPAPAVPAPAVPAPAVPAPAVPAPAVPAPAVPAPAVPAPAPAPAVPAPAVPAPAVPAPAVPAPAPAPAVPAPAVPAPAVPAPAVPAPAVPAPAVPAPAVPA